jgi:broad specificity phosphatase PhoE
VTGLPDIWLVRHGATEWSDQWRHTGRTDIPLTEEGRRQAASLCRPLDRERFELVLTSPEGRARDTARLAGFADAVVDDDLLEWDYGDYEGLTISQIRSRDPGWTVFTGACPNGETAEHIEHRVQKVIARCDQIEGRVLLFAHGHVLRVLTAVALGLGARGGAHFALDPATASVIGSEHDVRALRRWNEPAPGS